MADDENSDGFNFAITLLVAFGTIIYSAYSYFQTRAVDNYLYVSFVGVITVLLMTSFFLIIYIIVKGYSMEAHELEIRKNMENLATQIYSGTFEAGLLSLILVAGTFYFMIKGQLILVLCLYFIGGVGLSFYKLRLPYLFCWDNIPGSDSKRLIYFLTKNFGLDWVKTARIEKIYNDTAIILSTDKNSLSLMLNSEIDKANLTIDSARTDEFFEVKREKGKLNLYKQHPAIKEILIFFIIFFSIISPWPILYLPILDYMNGHVTIDMESIYYKNNTSIPVSIEVTGRNSESIIYLIKNSNNKLTQIENITLGPGHKDENVSDNNSILIGNAFDFGKYYIFINTSNPNMTVGYYELIYSRPIDGYKYGKSFYLLNEIEKT